MNHLIAVLLVALSYQPMSQAEEPPGATVRHVTDGDTVQIEIGGESIILRLVGIDASETHVPVPGGGTVGQGVWGERATEVLKRVLPLGQEVSVETKGVDAYGRMLGKVFVAGEDTNLKMVRMGWAIPYILCTGSSCTPSFFKKEKVADYLDACTAAQREGLGVFHRTRPLEEMPFEFRLRVQKRKADKWVGDFHTRYLFEPEQYRKVPICQRIFFYKEAEARRVGYRKVP